MIAKSWINGELVECPFSIRAQKQLLLISLYALRESYADTGWDIRSPQEAAEELMDGGLFVFVGSQLMCLSDVRPWFSNEHVITEEFVDPGIPLETVKAVMEYVCRLMGFKRYMVGTRAAANQRHAGLAKKYQQEGLSVSTVELMGVVHEQEDQEDVGQVRSRPPAG